MPRAKTETAKPRIPRASVIERRLLNPYDQGDRITIRLDPAKYPQPQELRWVNGDLSGRYHQMRTNRGWEPVSMDELADLNDVPDPAPNPPDSFVRRGEKGREILMRMPKSVYDAIQRRKTEIRMGQQTSAKALKDRLVASAEANQGAEAAEYLHQHVVGEVQTYRETRVDDNPDGITGE